MTDAYTPEYRGTPCMICGEPLTVRLAQGRKSGKVFVMLLCPKDARHFRAFINHQPYVKELLSRLEARGGQKSLPFGHQHDAGQDEASEIRPQRESGA